MTSRFGAWTKNWPLCGVRGSPRSGASGDRLVGDLLRPEKKRLI
jgi:hypothetical protein